MCNTPDLTSQAVSDFDVFFTFSRGRMGCQLLRASIDAQRPLAHPPVSTKISKARLPLSPHSGHAKCK